MYPPKPIGYITTSYKGDWETLVVDLNAVQEVNVVDNFVVASITAIVLEVVGCAGPWCVGAQIATNAVIAANDVATMNGELYIHYDEIYDPILDLVPRFDVSTGESVPLQFNIFPIP